MSCLVGIWKRAFVAQSAPGGIGARMRPRLVFGSNAQNVRHLAFEVTRCTISPFEKSRWAIGCGPCGARGPSAG